MLLNSVDAQDCCSVPWCMCSTLHQHNIDKEHINTIQGTQGLPWQEPDSLQSRPIPLAAFLWTK